MNDMSKKIKDLREQKGMTLEQVGNLVGVGKSTVRKWETGDIANMRRDKIGKLADALGTTPAYLMGWEEKDASKPEQKPGDASAPSNDLVEKAIELYNKFEELTPDKQREFLYFLEFLQSKP